MAVAWAHAHAITVVRERGQTIISKEAVKAATIPQFWNRDPGCPVSVSVSVSITNRRLFTKNLNAYLRVTITYLNTSSWAPTHFKTSATFHNINLRTSSYVTIVYRRSAIQGRAQINDFGYLVRGHCDRPHNRNREQPGIGIGTGETIVALHRLIRPWRHAVFKKGAFFWKSCLVQW